MSANGKKKLIYGLIGFGCGITLSGIMMLVVVLNTNEYQQGLINHISSTDVKESGIEQINTTQPSRSEKSPVNEVLTPKVDSVENNDLDKELIEDSLVLEDNQEELKSILVYIPENSTSTKICEILQEQGVILDAQEFEDYIKLNKKTKSLKSGEMLVPSQISYEELLKMLVTR